MTITRDLDILLKVDLAYFMVYFKPLTSGSYSILLGSGVRALV